MVAAFTLKGFAPLVALLPGLLVRPVLTAAPPAIEVGSQNSSILYSPAGSWSTSRLTPGFEGVFKFVSGDADKAEILWRTPGNHSLHCMP